MRKTYTHIELLDRFMSGKTSPEEERTLLAWFRDPDHKEEIMAFYKSRWEESSGKKLPLMATSKPLFFNVPAFIKSALSKF